MTISIIIVNFDTKDYIESLLESISLYVRNFEYEVLIINNSGESLEEVLPTDPTIRIRVLNPNKNLGFGKANNLGVEASKGDYLFFVNPDIVFTEETKLEVLIDKLESNDSVASVGPCLVTSEKKPCRNWRSFPSKTSLFLSYSGLQALIRRIGRKTIKRDCFVEQLDGAFFVMKRSTFVEIGGFDPDYFVYYEDVDLFRKIAESGSKVIITNDVRAIHVGGVTSGKSLTKVLPMMVFGLRLYLGKWYTSKEARRILHLVRRAMHFRSLILNVIGKRKESKMILEFLSNMEE